MRTKVLILTMLLLLSFCGTSFSGDTGTYQIMDYQVELVPKSDGTVELYCYQKWLVKSGHIPWITVGVPNNDYTIVGKGHSVKTIKKKSYGKEYWVEIQLDKDYKPNQVFEVSFKIVHTKLFEVSDTNYMLSYWPGWYERAIIAKLKISIRFFAEIKLITASPPPTSVHGEYMIWEKRNLGKGEKYKITVSFPKKLFPKINETKLKKSSGGGGIVILWILVCGFIGFIILLLILKKTTSGRSGRYYPSDEDDDDTPYTGGRIFYPTSRGSTRTSSGRSSRSSSGGGGFSGRSISCVCACVACACACACAGGGGAGCSKKREHICPKCQKYHEEKSE